MSITCFTSSEHKHMHTQYFLSVAVIQEKQIPSLLEPFIKIFRPPHAIFDPLKVWVDVADDPSMKTEGMEEDEGGAKTKHFAKNF